MTQKVGKILLAIGAFIIAALAVMGIISNIQGLISAIGNGAWEAVPGNIRGIGTNTVYLLAAIAGIIIVFSHRDSWFTVAKVFAVVIMIFVIAGLVEMFIYAINATIQTTYDGIVIAIVSPSLMTVAGILYCIGVFAIAKRKRR